MSNAPVVVTGASGFIASHIVSLLLERRQRVRGTVRDPKKVDGLRHLVELPGAGERLELVPGDLNQPGSFDEAVRGAELVLHTASPYVLTVKDPQKDLVNPAVNGTRNVLEACRRAGTVRRVILTSSMAAVTDEPDPDRVLTEDDWNEKSSLDRNPYYYSKTLAERAAWEIVKQGAPFELLVINPFLVIGPSLAPGVNTSNQVFVDLLGGKFPGIINVAWGFVDVRDVALAHVLAMGASGAHGRYVCANETVTMRRGVEMLTELGYGGAKLPKLGLDCAAGDFMVRLSSYFQPKGVGQYLRTHIGRTPRFDNAKIKRDLGLTFRPLAESFRDTIEDLRRWGHLPA